MTLIKAKESKSSECFLCGLRAEQREGQTDGEEILLIECRRCGDFAIDRALQLDRSVPQTLRPFISAATRQSAHLLILRQQNLPDLATSHRDATLAIRQEKILSYIADRCRRPGGKVKINQQLDWTIGDCSDEGEFRWHLDDLTGRCLVVRDQDAPIYSLTGLGWRAAEPMFQAGGIPGRCFVAMWFSPEVEDAYLQGIRPAIETDCGFRAIRVDEIPTNKGIPDRILAEIRLSQFVVADFTGQRPGVYFEAGFAQGLGREVIWTCREDQVKDLHFDTRHLGHVVWKTPLDLRRQLTESIRANIIPKR